MGSCPWYRWRSIRKPESQETDRGSAGLLRKKEIAAPERDNAALYLFFSDPDPIPDFMGSS